MGMFNEGPGIPGCTAWKHCENIGKQCITDGICAYAEHLNADGVDCEECAICGESCDGPGNLITPGKCNGYVE